MKQGATQEHKTRILIGAGGHAAVLADLLAQQNKKIDYLVAPGREGRNYAFANIPMLNKDDAILQWQPKECVLVNGLGAMPTSNLRRKIFMYFKEKGYQFETLIADSANVSQWAQLQEGSQILQGAIIQAGTVIGANSIINTAAQIDHDCHIGQHCHIAPSAVLCGGVTVKQNAIVGANAVIIPGLLIGVGASVGAGTSVARNVLEQQVLIPASNRIRS